MSVHSETRELTDVVLRAAEKAREETSSEPNPGAVQPPDWPIECTVGPGLEGAIACESKIGYVNGGKGWLIYRGYNIFDLCAYSTYEEVSYLLLHGELPTARQLRGFKRKLAAHRDIPNTMRHLMTYQVEEMNPMAALRLGTLLLRQRITFMDRDGAQPDAESAIGSDEDSIAMETVAAGSGEATYQFPQKTRKVPREPGRKLSGGEDFGSAYRLIAAEATITAAIARLRQGRLPIEPDPELSHAGNLLYMMTGRKPDPIEERVMDISLILHADHGMNASTFAAMVVASTLSDIYFSVGAGIAALNGPLHGGANEEVLHLLEEIRAPERVDKWYAKARAQKRKVSGFGHRVYKAYDPRARILGPLAGFLVNHTCDPAVWNLHQVATELENKVVSTLGKTKKIFPNVDFYSGIVYRCLDIPPALFTPLFAVSRVAGWSARVLEYLENNRIFRPRAIYTGELDRAYTPMSERRPHE